MILGFTSTHTWRILHSIKYFARKTKLTIPQSKQMKGLTKKQIEDIIILCKRNENQQARLFIEKYFYANITNQSNLQKIIEWKNSIDFYFRDYPELMTNFENENLLHKKKEEMFVKSVLVNLLTNHLQLKILIENKNKYNLKNIASFYIVSLSRLVLGQFQQGEKQILYLINSSIAQILMLPARKDINQNDFTLLDTTEPYILNYRQQIFFNFLCYKMYADPEIQEQSKKTEPSQLIKKIKNKTKLIASDFQLTNYEQFLNLWLVQKGVIEHQWAELIEVNQQPYVKYIYLMAQNKYLKKEYEKSNEILSELPSNYPLRNFLELIQLFDSQNLPQFEKKFSKIEQIINNNECPFYNYPQLDVIKVNLLELASKMQQKKIKALASEKDQQIIKEEVKRIKETQQQYKMQILLLKENLNIVNIDPMGLPFYYLDFPFFDMLTTPEFKEALF